jgi:predicted nuclease with TOPRIM domain
MYKIIGTGLVKDGTRVFTFTNQKELVTYLLDELNEIGLDYHELVSENEELRAENEALESDNDDLEAELEKYRDE